jgi:hypothetical protein
MNEAQKKYYFNYVLNHSINSIGDWLRIKPWKKS